MPSATLRQATREDIPQIFRVRYAVRENRLADGYVISDEDVQQAIEETGRGWVIALQNEIAAFAIGNSQTGNIWALFVDPAAEGRGYGQRLHAEMVTWLWTQNLQVLWLNTDPNTRAHKFYERLGWRAAGTNEDGESRLELRQLDWQRTAQSQHDSQAINATIL